MIMDDKFKKEEATTDDTNAPIGAFLGNSQYLQFDEEGVIEGSYLGCQLEDDNFNPGQQRVAYLFDLDGEQKAFSSSSKRLAKAFLKANPKVGDTVRITRTGEGYDTQFDVEANPTPF